MALSGNRPFHEKHAVDFLHRANVAWQRAASTSSCRYAIQELIEVARNVRAAQEHLTAIVDARGRIATGPSGRGRRSKLLAHVDKIKRQVDEALRTTPCLSRDAD